MSGSLTDLACKIKHNLQCDKMSNDKVLIVI